MKKNYQKPAMQAVAISQRSAILQLSTVQSVGGNAQFNSTISGGSGSARSREFDDWDDEE